MLAACRLAAGTVQAYDCSDSGIEDGASQPSEMEKEETLFLKLLQPWTFMCAAYFAVMRPLAAPLGALVSTLKGMTAPFTPNVDRMVQNTK